MRGLMYSAVFENVAVAAAQDLFKIVAPSDAIVVLHAVYLSQNTEAGDAESEQLDILFHRGTTAGSGGSTPTPRPLQIGFPAAGSTVAANNTTVSTEGVQLHAEAFNVMAGLQYIPTPETRIILSPSGQLNVTLQSTPADSITMNGVIYFEEIGGG